MISKGIYFGVAFLITLIALPTFAESPLVLDHNGSTIALEPYAPNIIRVTLSLE